MKLTAFLIAASFVLAACAHNNDASSASVISARNQRQYSASALSDSRQKTAAASEIPLPFAPLRLCAFASLR